MTSRQEEIQAKLEGNELQSDLETFNKAIEGNDSQASSDNEDGEEVLSGQEEDGDLNENPNLAQDDDKDEDSQKSFVQSRFGSTPVSNSTLHENILRVLENYGATLCEITYICNICKQKAVSSLSNDRAIVAHHRKCSSNSASANRAEQTREQTSDLSKREKHNAVARKSNQKLTEAYSNLRELLRLDMNVTKHGLLVAAASELKDMDETKEVRKHPTLLKNINLFLDLSEGDEHSVLSEALEKLLRSHVGDMLEKCQRNRGNP